MDFLQALRLSNLFNNPPDSASTPLPSNPLSLNSLNTPNISSNPPDMSPINPSITPTDSSINPDIITQMMNKLYQPEHTASDKYNQLLSNYPTDKGHSRLARLGAALLGAGATYATSDNRHAGNIDTGIKVGTGILDYGHQGDVTDWKNQIGPAGVAANLERQSNVNERTLAYQTISEKLRAESLKHKEENDNVLNKIKQQRADIYDFKAKNPGSKLVFTKGGNVMAVNPTTGESIDTGISTGTLSDADKMNLTQENALEKINETGKQQRETEQVKQTGRETIAETRGWQTANIPDPNNPGQMIGVKINQITGEVHPIKLEGQQVGPISKSSSNITQSTKTMMEGATMLRPHINDLRNQAIDLDKRGLFGPVMSRIRDFAAKVGTTGSPEQVQSSLDNFANAIQNDPRINASNDRVVGQFLSNLGLMASGAGRVHGGARGGGSIQMVTYLKSLLSSSSTLDMFQGRLDTLDDYMKGYSAGPIPATTSIKKSKIDMAIDDILKGVK